MKWMQGLNPKEDPEGAERWWAAQPETSFGQSQIGVPTSIGVWMTTTISRYGTPASTDPELIYHLVKWLDENFDKYKDAHTLCVFMTLDILMELAETDYMPLHDGTVKYLEEKGLWTEAHEKRRQEQIELITRYIEAYSTAIEMADDMGIRIDPYGEEWLEFWENYKEELGLPKFHKYPRGLE